MRTLQGITYIYQCSRAVEFGLSAPATLSRVFDKWVPIGDLLYLLVIPPSGILIEIFCPVVSTHYPVYPFRDIIRLSDPAP